MSKGGRYGSAVIEVQAGYMKKSRHRGMFMLPVSRAGAFLHMDALLGGHPFHQHTRNFFKLAIISNLPTRLK